MFRHALAPLLAPASVALVGATEREGALGRLLWQNLAAGGLRGALSAVNPKHRSVFGQRCYARLAQLPQPPEAAVFVTPARTLPGLIAEAGAAGVRAAVVLSSGFGEAGPEGLALQEAMLAAARPHGLRILGPNCLGLMRTDTGLNATFSPVAALPGRLALVSQSGAICTSILDWARGSRIGFSSVVSLGGAADVDFGEILDFLVTDAATDAILLYVEGIRDARRYMSALRAAARVKPVIALKVGRHAAGSRAASRLATLGEPLLFVLHAGYGWLVVGFGLLGLSGVVPLVPHSAALHALAVGAIGTMTLAVMTRATLGHSGQPLSAGGATVLIYLLVTVAALLRIAAPLAGASFLALTWAAAAAWSGAFLLFAFSYRKLLLPGKHVQAPRR